MDAIKGIDIPQANAEVQAIFEGLAKMAEQLEQWQAQLGAIQPKELPKGWYDPAEVRREAKRLSKLLNPTVRSLGHAQTEMSVFRTWFRNMAKEYTSGQKTAQFDYDRRQAKGCSTKP